MTIESLFPSNWKEIMNNNWDHLPKKIHDDLTHWKTVFPDEMLWLAHECALTTSLLSSAGITIFDAWIQCLSIWDQKNIHTFDELPAEQQEMFLQDAMRKERINALKQYWVRFTEEFKLHIKPEELLHLSTWKYQFGYSGEVITRAYQQMLYNVRTGKSAHSEISLTTMHAILTQWHNHRLRTLSDIEKYEGALENEQNRKEEPVEKEEPVKKDEPFTFAKLIHDFVDEGNGINGKGSILCLTPGTGTGKGYGMAHFICDQMKAFEEEKHPRYKRIIYISDRHNTIKDMIKQRQKVTREKNYEFDEDDFLYLVSNTDQFVESLDKLQLISEMVDEKEGPALFCSIIDVSLKKLIRDILFYNELVARKQYALKNADKANLPFWVVKKEHDERIADYEKNTLLKSEQKFTADTVKAFNKYFEQYKKQRQKLRMALKQKYAVIKKDKFLQLFLDVFPAMKLPFAKVIFMTMTKAMLPLNTILNGTMRIHAKKFASETIYLIDESDSCYNAILEAMIEAAAGNPENMLTMAKNFYDIINTARTKGGIPKTVIGEEEAKLCDEFIKEFKETDEKFHLYEPYKVESADIARTALYHPNVKLLTTRHGVEVSGRNMSGEDLYLTYDAKIPATIFHKKVEKTDTEDAQFETFLYSVSHLVRMGSFIIRWIAQNWQYTLKTGEEDPPLSDMINNTLHRLCVSFASAREHPMVNEYIRLIESPPTSRKVIEDLNRKETREGGTDRDDLTVPERAKTQNSEFVSDDYYLNGFNYTVFGQINEDDMNVYLNNYAMVDTPEKWIYRISTTGAKIVLASATGSLLNPFGNFDLEYDRLAPQLYRLSEEQKQEIKTYIQTRQSRIRWVNGAPDYLDIEEFDTGTEVVEFEEYGSEYDHLIKTIEQKTGIPFPFRPSAYLEEKRADLVRTKNEKTTSFYLSRDMGMILPVLKSWLKGTKVLLMLAPPSYENTGEGSVKVFKAFMDALVKYSNREEVQRVFRPVGLKAIRSENYTEDTRQEICNSADKGEFVLIFASYQTMMKGVNLIITRNLYQQKEFVAINDSGWDKLVSAPGELNTDIDAIALVTPTNLSFETFTKDSPDRIKNTLKILGKIEKLYQTGIISYSRRIDYLSRTIRDECSIAKPKDSENGRYAIAVYAHLMQILMQSVGRIGRTDVRSVNTTIYLDRGIYPILKDCEDIGLTEDVIAQQSPEVKAMIHYLRNKTIHGEETKQNRLKLSRMAQEAETLCEQALQEMAAGDPTMHKELVSACTKIIRNDIGNLSENARKMYFPVTLLGTYTKKGKEQYHTGYCYTNTDDKIVIIPDDNGSNSIDAITNALKTEYAAKEENIAPFILGVLQKYQLSISNNVDRNSYILTPKGFDIFRGNLGEALAREYFEQVWCVNTMPMPDAVHEVMDFYFEYRGGVVCVDAKFYSNPYAEDREFIREQTSPRYLHDKYARKTERVTEYFGKEPVMLVLNTRPAVYDKVKCYHNIYQNSDGLISVVRIFDSEPDEHGSFIDMTASRKLQSIVNKKLGEEE